LPYATGYAVQQHAIITVGKDYWLFYIKDSGSTVIKTRYSEDGHSWNDGSDIPLNPVDGGTTWSIVDGYSFSVAYASINGTDVAHIIVNAVGGGGYQTFHIRATLAAPTVTAGPPFAIPGTTNGNPCPEDGPVTVVTPNGYVYDVTAWTVRGYTNCDTNIYVSAAPDDGSSWTAGFNDVGYFVSQPGYADSHSIVSVGDAGNVLATYPDWDEQDTYEYSYIGVAPSSAFPASLAAGTFETKMAELFYGFDGTVVVGADDWSVCRPSGGTTTFVVRHFYSYPLDVDAGSVDPYAGGVDSFDELVVGPDGGWTEGQIDPPAVASSLGTGVAMVIGSPTTMVLGAIDQDGGAISLLTASSFTTADAGGWTRRPSIPAPAGGATRQSLVGTGCGSTAAPPLLLWTEMIPSGGGYVIKGAQLVGF